MAIIVVGYETTATARWALLFIVRAFFNDTLTIAVWTGFHVAPHGDDITPPYSAPTVLVQQVARQSVGWMTPP